MWKRTGIRDVDRNIPKLASIKYRHNSRCVSRFASMHANFNLTRADPPAHPPGHAPRYLAGGLRKLHASAKTTPGSLPHPCLHWVGNKHPWGATQPADRTRDADTEHVDFSSPADGWTDV